MNKPLIVICLVLVAVLGFLVVYSQTGLPVKETAAEGGHGGSAGYGGGAAPAGGYGGGAAPAGGYGAPQSGGYGK